MSSNIKAPPSLSKCSSYDEWLKEIEIWQAFTDLADIKQGPAIFLTLEGRSREAVRELDVSKISAKDGVKNIMEKLDGLYLRDKTQSAFEAYDAFEKFCRPSEMSISEYINQFERLKSKTESYKTQLSTDVLAYRLLKSANLSEAHEQLARATIPELTYEAMKNQLKKIFADGDKSSNTIASGFESIKSEPPFQSQSDVFYGNNQRYNRNKFVKNANMTGDHISSDQKSGSIKKKGRNPLKRNGEISRCNICDSLNHWSSNCPDKIYYNQPESFSDDENQNNSAKNHHVTLFQSSLVTEAQQKIFVSETLNTAVLDSGATGNVAGKAWLDCYLTSLSDTDRNLVEYNNSSNGFKFGSDDIFTSLYKVKIPACIGSQRVFIETDVIDTDVPLLLSQKAMKTAGTSINFVDDSVTMFGESQDVVLTRSGHYSVPLSNSHKILKDAVESSAKIILHVSPKYNDDKTKTANKLHSQFAHPTSDKLIKLVSSAGLGNDLKLIQAIKDVSQSCDVCKIYKKPSPRPAVGMPLACDFNEVVALDLKFFHGHIILHLIDHVSRFSAASLIKSKKPNAIIDAIFKIWISVFGPPKRFLSDNGGEFVNGEFLDMCEAYGIVVLTTAAESPWSNGLCERHNAVLADMLQKVTEEQNCTLPTAICWAIHAKNSLSNVHGFSPYQIAIGRTPKLPCVLDSDLPAMECPENPIVLGNLKTMQAARKAFMEAESSERLKRALKHNIRTNNGQKFVSGDIVYYKRNDSKKWRGPAKVLGMDSQQVLLKHGGTYVRVHTCRVMLQREDKPNENLENSEANTITTREKFVKGNDHNGVENQLGDISSSESSNDPSEYDSADDHDDTLDDNLGTSTENPPQVTESDIAQPPSPERKTLKKGMTIEYRESDSDNWKRVRVTSRAGKATGQYKSHWNIDNDGSISQIDTNKVEWKPAVTEDVIYSTDVIYKSQQVSSEVDKATVDAKRRELDNWVMNEVYEEVEDIGQDTISVRWVITPKLVNDQWTTKARLVARGFQENVDDLRTDSPTCMKETMRLVLFLASSMKWKINSIDIKAAFLQGKPINRRLYLKPPKEAAAEGKLWKLKKAVYGLSDASRVWYLRVVDELSRLRVAISDYDKALFIWKNDNKVEGLLSIHVDDFMWCGSENFRKSVIEKLKETFKISKESTEIFRYLGIDLQQNQKIVVFDQSAYVDSIDPINIPKVNESDKNNEVDDNLRKQYKALVGQIGWASGTSRPDACFNSCVLGNSQAKPTYRNLAEANKALKDLKNNKFSIKFPPLDLSSIKISVFCDASYANLYNGSSQGGHIVFLSDKTNLCVPISWASRKLKRVVKSTLGAETLAATEAVDSAYMVGQLLTEILSEKNNREIVVHTDNKSLYDTVRTSNVASDKRLRVDVAYIREAQEKDKVSFKWIESSRQLADALTKQGASKTKLLEVLNSARLQE